MTLKLRSGVSHRRTTIKPSCTKIIPKNTDSVGTQRQQFSHLTYKLKHLKLPMHNGTLLKELRLGAGTVFDKQLRAPVRQALDANPSGAPGFLLPQTFIATWIVFVVAYWVLPVLRGQQNCGPSVDRNTSLGFLVDNQMGPQPLGALPSHLSDCRLLNASFSGLGSLPALPRGCPLITNTMQDHLDSPGIAGVRFGAWMASLAVAVLVRCEVFWRYCKVVEDLAVTDDNGRLELDKLTPKQRDHFYQVIQAEQLRPNIFKWIERCYAGLKENDLTTPEGLPRPKLIQARQQLYTGIMQYYLLAWAVVGVSANYRLFYEPCRRFLGSASEFDPSLIRAAVSNAFSLHVMSVIFLAAGNAMETLFSSEWRNPDMINIGLTFAFVLGFTVLFFSQQPVVGVCGREGCADRTDPQWFGTGLWALNEWLVPLLQFSTNIPHQKVIANQLTRYWEVADNLTADRRIQSVVHENSKQYGLYFPWKTWLFVFLPVAAGMRLFVIMMDAIGARFQEEISR